MDKQKQMLDAIELFHYARKFSHKKFVVYFEKNRQVSEFIFDFKLLTEAKVQFFIVMHQTDEYQMNLEDWGNYGIQLTKTTIDFDADYTIPSNDNADSKIIVLKNIKNHTEQNDFIVNLSQKIHAQRIMYMSQFGKLNYADKKRAYVDHHELQSIVNGNKKTNYTTEFLKIIYNIVVVKGIEITVLKDNVGSIFEEVFTHTGSGTMFTFSPTMSIQAAQEKDCMEIMVLMKSYIEQGAILPMDRAELQANIQQAYAYKIDHKIVAFAMFKHYSDGSEISRFCTLPRYRGKGLAQKLAMHMIEIAKIEKRKYLFALSILPLMWDFFINLGFKETQRTSLPKEWQSHYDFSRDSKAFVLELD